MVALSKFSTNVQEWPKWQIALLLAGGLTTLGFLYYYRSRDNKPPLAEISGTVQQNVENQEPSVINSPDTNAAQLEGIDLALNLKEEGNKLFKEKTFPDAIVKYTEAIRVCPPHETTYLSTFYQNRAAAYDSLKKYDEVIKDCTNALNINASYVKALNRRAKAYEQERRLNEALDDMTAVCILERFQNMSSIHNTDKVLKFICLEKAREIMKTKEFTLPSFHFVDNYFTSFKYDPVVLALKDFEQKEKKTVDVDTLSGYKKALYFMSEKLYDEVLPCCNEEIAREGPYYKEALLMGATYKLLLARFKEAREDLNLLLTIETIDSNTRVNVLIKQGAVDVHYEDLVAALGQYEAAIKINPNNCDIYRHRAQIYLFLERYREMLGDIDKCISLQPDIPDVLAQKYFIEFKNATIYMDGKLKESALKAFEDLHKRYPKCAPAYFLHAQIKGELDEFDNAEEYFHKAHEADPNDGNILTHLGLLVLHYKRNLPEALNLINKAIAVDPKCGLALETMGTIEVQRGNLEKGIEVYKKAIAICRSEAELTHILSLQEAARAQLKVAERLGINFNSIASSLEAPGY